MPLSCEEKPDTYLIIKLGSIVINDSEFIVEQSLNPEFYRSFEIPCDLPGAATIKIEVWEHHTFYSDELIGSTSIDCEFRYLN